MHDSQTSSSGQPVAKTCNEYRQSPFVETGTPSLVYDARMRFRTKYSTLAIAALVLCLTGSTVGQEQAADRVTVRRAGNRREFDYSGRVLDYTGGILRLRLKTSGNVRQFKTDEILRIETPQTEQHRNGLKLFEAGKYPPSVVALTSAVREEPRDWVRRDILALLSRIHLRYGNRLAAAEAFVRLTDSDPKSHHFGAIPLWWSDQPTSPAEQRQARLWLVGPNYSARLIAASILVQSPDTRGEATRTLEQIASSGRQQFVDLARSQQWRERLLSDKPLGDAEIHAWKSRLKSMKQDQRAGPWFLLGHAHSKRLQPDRAARAYLWVPLVYPDDNGLAAEASLNAAVALEKGGRLTAAESLYRETAERFSETPFGRQAATRLQPRPPVPQR